MSSFLKYHVLRLKNVPCIKWLLFFLYLNIPWKGELVTWAGGGRGALLYSKRCNIYLNLWMFIRFYDTRKKYFILVFPHSLLLLMCRFYTAVVFFFFLVRIIMLEFSSFLFLWGRSTSSTSLYHVLVWWAFKFYIWRFFYLCSECRSVYRQHWEHGLYCSGPIQQNNHFMLVPSAKAHFCCEWKSWIPSINGMSL